MYRLGMLAGLAAALVSAAADPATTPDEGVLPVGANGRPLNLDFEAGSLQGWTADGDFAQDQPVRGDTVAPRKPGMRSRHQGEFWFGGYETAGDAARGRLTSAPFAVTHPWASFRVGGGSKPGTRVEVVRQDTGEVMFRASGDDREDMRRVAVDLRPVALKQVFVRIVDEETGGWGHVNFDDFRFHSDKPKAETPPVVPPPAVAGDQFRHAGLEPGKAAAAMTVPEGFTVTLFAGEPDVTQPVALCLDDRGRVWVAEAHSYPIRRPDGQGKDRIVIFEDADGDGRFDKRTVFLDGLNLVSGLEVGFGGVWIGAAPNLLFVPVKPGEDKPAGEAKVLLDGWGYQDTHETLNTFTWGPDGWLYGCHGVFTHSRVGKPGTPDADRQPINAGVWRYHPTKHTFEVFAHGTSNPWGLDFNDTGDAFVEACVIPHLYHVVQGGRYQRQAGTHFDPNTYGDIKTIADHLHYLGSNPHGGNNKSDAAGGGHAHCGTMIYLGGAWPTEYRGRMFMGNVHGRRLNTDLLLPKGSGYVASHGPDFLLANDAWARFINLRYGPDGDVYLIDWYDKQACHTGNVNVWDRSNGRVYKVGYRGTKKLAAQPDLRKLSDGELVALQTHANDWYVRHARRILQERGGGGPEVHAALASLAFGSADEPKRLRGLWALQATGGLDEARVRKGLADQGEHVRGWTVQLALEGGKPSPEVLARLAGLAASDPSPVVRRYLASGLQRLPAADRWAVLAGLLSHPEDAADHNLPLLYWYAAEPLAAADPARALDLAVRSRVPPVPQYIIRRIGTAGTPDAIQQLTLALAKTGDPALQQAFLRGMADALSGRRNVGVPAAWPAAADGLAASADAEVRSAATVLAVTFGDPKAFAALRKTLADSATTAQDRLTALAALAAARDAELPPLLHPLVADATLRRAAVRALAGYDDPRTPDVILGAYGRLTQAEKREALNALASRVPYARTLLDAVADGRIPRPDLSADLVRQLRNLQDKDLDRKIAETWGVARTSPADRVQAIADSRQKWLRLQARTPDVALGRAVFARTCQQCHTLFGAGGNVGPDITGANRSDLNYLLENMLDPSAVIPKEYAPTVLSLADGRVVTGIVRGETPAALTVVTPTETLTVARADVESRKQSDVSMMPDDLLKQLPDDEFAALIAYLQSPTQTPILATVDTAKDLFDGKSLAGWDGDVKLWSVENGEIVGRSPGIKHNEFLKSRLLVGDFRLTLKVKLTPDGGNSGVQFRSAPLPNGEMRGPQADIGKGWWGKLYEESGRGLLWKQSGETHVKPGEWNEYEIVAEGPSIRTRINDKPCVDLTDPAVSRRGIFGLQIHAGGPMEVRFKDLKLEVPTAGPPGSARKDQSRADPAPRANIQEVPIHKPNSPADRGSVAGADRISGATAAVESAVGTFKRIQLGDQFWSEGAAFGDLNRDGKADIVAGPWWWEGPAFRVRHEIYPPNKTFDLKVGPLTAVKVPGFEGGLGKKNVYSDNFFAFVRDFDADGWNDVLVIGFPGKETYWYRNPGAGNRHWDRYLVLDETSNESPTFDDITGDGRPELVCINRGGYGYAQPDEKDPTKPWIWHPITPRKGYGAFTHGMGIGDVNADGRPDLLVGGGWWEQPKSLADDPEWTFHPARFGTGGAQMYVYDVNGDGRADVVTSLSAHGYGLAWFEAAEGEPGRIAFKEHVIMGKTPQENRHGVSFAELHAVALTDVDGDGVKDIVTGTRFWSHGATAALHPGAPLYWFRLVREPGGNVDWVPHLIDGNSGVGTQVVAGDIDGDGMPDIVVGNKQGVFVHLQQRKRAGR